MTTRLTLILGVMALIVTLVSAAFFSASTVRAQAMNGWSEPRRLSSRGIDVASEAYMVTDQYGFVHVFWTETPPDSDRTNLMYTRFDGEIWTDPVDIYISAPGLPILFVSPFVDATGRIHIVWNELNTGPVYYSSALAPDAASAWAWEMPKQIRVPAFRPRIAVGNDGVLHLAYINFYAQEPGLYYVMSEDKGLTWSRPLWLDPDIPLGQAPQHMQMVMDDKGGIHLLWYYITTGGVQLDTTWIRYAHSLNGGKTWRNPFTVDENDDEPGELRSAYPELVVAGDTVHIVWAGNAMVQREARISEDRGLTFGDTERILGTLQGQGLGGGLIVDAHGRTHYFAQIRWPQAVYHTIWENGAWGEPEPAYFIAKGSNEDRNGRYHAHSVRAAIRSGNHIVLTFTDEAAGPLYVMDRTLDDVESIPALPLPTATLLPTATPAQEEATPTPAAPRLTDRADGILIQEGTGAGVWQAVIPAIFVLFAVAVARAYWVARRR